MSGRRKLTKVMYMEDADDESGHAIEGTAIAASVASSPTKERPNTGKSRKSERSSRKGEPGYTDSDSTVHPSGSSRKEKEKEKERIKTKEKERVREGKEKERERSSSKKSVTIRPAVKQAKTDPVLSQSRRTPEEQFYGVKKEAPAITTHNSRPPPFTSGHQYRHSYYGPASRPPSASAKYHHGNGVSRSWTPTPGAYPAQHAPVPAPPVDMAAAQYHNLAQRFQQRPPQRPASAIGFRPSPPSAFGDNYPEPHYDGGLSRQSSLRRRQEEDRQRMPPPPAPRPLSTRPIQAPYRPPAPQLNRRSVGFDDADLAGDPELYTEVAQRPPFDLYSAAIARPRPRRPSVSYNMAEYMVQPATTNDRRRSWYGGSPTALDDKLAQAAAYQNDLSGAHVPLTKENMRRAGRRSTDVSSRSTRSSASRDESDWRQSATTRTTRSSGDEDITIKVTGPTVLKVGGAEIQCQEGGEINIARQPSLRGNSDKASSVLPDDRQSRAERQTTRTRAPSQSGSWSRTTPSHYEPYPSYSYAQSTHYQH